MIEHIIIHSVTDSVKLLPFLFITYLVMEYLEHKTSNHMNSILKKAGPLGPVLGAILGVFPQCGFSAAASNLYAGKVITIGTLAAVFLSTSDEMLPIFVSNQVDILVIARILAVKVMIGPIAGMGIDFVYKLYHKEKEENHIHEICEHDHCHCEKGIFRSALVHTVQIFFFIFFVTFCLNIVLELGAEEQMHRLATDNSILTILIMGIVGMIPNCASSVVVTELYLEGIVGAGAMMSGLLAGSGVGLLVLFRTNRHLKENGKFAFMLYVISIASGLVIELLGINFM